MRARTLWMIWGAILAYSCVCGFGFQLFVLPVLLPSWHVGDGLMVGGDWIGYHQEANELRALIQQEGWSSWTLRYGGHSLSGLLGALYAVTLPKPWVWVPISALLHATSAILLLLLIRRFVGAFWISLVAALPFVIFPSTWLWIMQPLKDGISIAGFLLVLHAMAKLIDIVRSARFAPSQLAGFAAALLSGLILTWIAREYLVVLLQAIACISAIAILAQTIPRLLNRTIGLPEVLLIASITGVVLFSPTLFPDTKKSQMWTTETLTSIAEETRSTFESDSSYVASTSTYWTPSSLLPAAADGFLQTVAKQRYLSIVMSRDAVSAIDVDVTFQSDSDVFHYIPRAVQIALFAPFPSQWFAFGDSVGGRFRRTISAVEMVLAYVLLPFAGVAVWLWGRKLELWILGFFCIPALIIHPMFIANVGTIVRLRYPYFSTILCVCFAALLVLGEYGFARCRKCRPASKICEEYER